MCLTCLQGFCAAPHQSIDHTQLHFKLTNGGSADQHPIFMNLKMVKKPEVPSESKEITKLAIGVPGGIDANTDKFDT